MSFGFSLGFARGFGGAEEGLVPLETTRDFGMISPHVALKVFGLPRRLETEMIAQAADFW